MISMEAATTESLHTIRTERLDLVALPAVALEALVAGNSARASSIVGVALPSDLGRRAQSLLILRLADLRSAPRDAPWLLRVVALRSERRPMVGLTGFHGRPDSAGTAEVGYEINPEYRGRGYAREAAAAVTNWALTDGGARRVIAAIRPDNEGSLGVARSLGFTPAGSRWDAVDGTALLFERRTPISPTGAKMREAGGGDRREERAMTDDQARDVYPDRHPTETHAIRARLTDVFGNHRADPSDPEHKCLCGFDGESYDDHLAWSTLRDMKDVGYEVWPARH